MQPLVRAVTRPSGAIASVAFRSTAPVAVRTVLAFSSPTTQTTIRTKKTKASKKSAATLYQEGDEEYADGPGKGKGGKKGKGKMLVTNEEERGFESMQLPGEKFDSRVLDDRMKDGIERLRVNLKTVVGRVGRVSPGEFACSARTGVLVFGSSHTRNNPQSLVGQRQGRLARGQATFERVCDRLDQGWKRFARHLLRGSGTFSALSDKAEMPRR